MSTIVSQVFDASKCMKDAPHFIKENKLWEGYLKHGWIAKTTFVLSFLAAFLFFREVLNDISSTSVPENEVQLNSINAVFIKLADAGGMSKYILLILLEMLIFHFSTRTMDVLENKENTTTAKEFISAQIRMIKVSFRNFGLEIAISIVLGIALGIAGIGSLKSILMLFVEFYFIGFAFMDNFFEQKKMTIKESSKYIRKQYVGAIIIGGFGYLFFMVPILGAIIAPFICSVAATIYLYYKTDKGEDLITLDTEDISASLV